ncbi:MAG TPA: DUF2264 domain-containing protein [Candidatus Acidoferrales bacterium]|nr:DUF2264 domain-containing protein [Candidatus Acidoferrales bacterium]
MKSATALGVAGAANAGRMSSAAQSQTASQANDRSYWIETLEKVTLPVIENLSKRELRKNMPVEAANPVDRAKYTHLEAFGRTLCGVAPWLAAQGTDAAEAMRQKRFANLARESLDAATDPHSPDFLNFNQGSQPLVDAAFMAQGILRAPSTLWQPLDTRVKSQIVAALLSSRSIPTPTSNNWVLFAATVEAALQTMGGKTIEERFENCVTRMMSWYKGDGAYGDGEFFHFDYYNSFVIHPMLIDALSVLRQKDAQFDAAYSTELTRAKRYAQVLERWIAPDGSFPSIGRSTTYRFGAFHALAQIAWMRELPGAVKPAQARCAMTAVMRKMMDAPGTFDASGWLQIGFCGHQPALAETYISTGSLYMCAAAFLPLGLPSSDEFWSAPPAPWTQQMIWSGQSLPADHAISA